VLFRSDRNETLGRKIRDTEVKRIPIMLIVGEKEAENRQVSVRMQGVENGDKGAMNLDEFIGFFKGLLENE
jgi:threonyl-tRNA synthetase